uniref:Aminopeptidase N-like N-terminal domain-containing protein n=1 Tax=Timema bartmani TaxID=61472 RepID=A0A7R9EQD6_9NEOP|nr:unnamed protein product [Timema bartmani]
MTCPLPLGPLVTSVKTNQSKASLRQQKCFTRTGGHADRDVIHVLSVLSVVERIRLFSSDDRKGAGAGEKLFELLQYYRDRKIRVKPNLAREQLRKERSTLLAPQNSREELRVKGEGARMIHMLIYTAPVRTIIICFEVMESPRTSSCVSRVICVFSHETEPQTEPKIEINRRRVRCADNTTLFIRKCGGRSVRIYRLQADIVERVLPPVQGKPPYYTRPGSIHILPVIGSLVCLVSDVFDHAATEADTSRIKKNEYEDVEPVETNQNLVTMAIIPLSGKIPMVPAGYRTSGPSVPVVGPIKGELRVSGIGRREIAKREREEYKLLIPASLLSNQLFWSLTSRETLLASLTSSSALNAKKSVSPFVLDATRPRLTSGATQSNLLLCCRFLGVESVRPVTSHMKLGGCVPAFVWREIGKPTLSTPDRDSNLVLPVIGSLVYYESGVLDHTATESRRLRCAGYSVTVFRVLTDKPNGKRPLARPRSKWEVNIGMNLTEKRRITENLDGASYRTGLAEKAYKKNKLLNLYFVLSPVIYVCVCVCVCVCVNPGKMSQARGHIRRIDGNSSARTVTDMDKTVDDVALYYSSSKPAMSRPPSGPHGMTQSLEALTMMDGGSGNTVTFGKKRGYVVSRGLAIILGLIFVGGLVATGLLVHKFSSCVDSETSSLSSGVITSERTKGKYNSTTQVKTNTTSDLEVLIPTPMTEVTTSSPPQVPPKAPKLDVRLPRAIKPDSYDIKIIPFIVEGNFTFHGAVSIVLNVTQDTRNVTLHVNDIKVLQDTVEVVEERDTNGFVAVQRISNDSARQFLVLHLAGVLTAGRQYTVRMRYIGNLNDALQGFYRSSYIVNNQTRFFWGWLESWGGGGGVLKSSTRGYPHPKGNALALAVQEGESGGDKWFVQILRYS